MILTKLVNVVLNELKNRFVVSRSNHNLHNEFVCLFFCSLIMVRTLYFRWYDHLSVGNHEQCTLLLQLHYHLLNLCFHVNKSYFNCKVYLILLTLIKTNYCLTLNCVKSCLFINGTHWNLINNKHGDYSLVVTKEKYTKLTLLYYYYFIILLIHFKGLLGLKFNILHYCLISSNPQ